MSYESFLMIGAGITLILIAMSLHKRAMKGRMKEPKTNAYDKLDSEHYNGRV